MPHYTEYTCGKCGKCKPRERLLRKEVLFKTMGPKPSVARQRTVGFICFDCVEDDNDFQIPAYASPGQKSAAKERLDKIKAALGD